MPPSPDLSTRAASTRMRRRTSSRWSSAPAGLSTSRSGPRRQTSSPRSGGGAARSRARGRSWLWTPAAAGATAATPSSGSRTCAGGEGVRRGASNHMNHSLLFAAGAWMACSHVCPCACSAAPLLQLFGHGLGAHHLHQVVQVRPHPPGRHDIAAGLHLLDDAVQGGACSKGCTC